LTNLRHLLNKIREAHRPEAHRKQSHSQVQT